MENLYLELISLFMVTIIFKYYHKDLSYLINVLEYKNLMDNY